MGTEKQESSGEFHSSIHPTSLSDDVLMAQSEVQRTRRGGPGGQHRNKVESAIVITHLPTGVIGQASERRSQHENRDVALVRLRMNLALAVRTNVSVDQKPSQLWMSRVSNRKIQVSNTHNDFPVIIAESLDFLFACEFDISMAAQRLELSTSQLIKLLKQQQAAWELVGKHREKLGLHRLK